jgi:hypothetical protein
MSESHEWQDKLSTLVSELEVTRQRAAKEATDEATQVLINYAALAPYANPELLPPFPRLITRRGQSNDPRCDPRYPLNPKGLTPRRIYYGPSRPPPGNPDGTWRRDDLPYS